MGKDQESLEEMFIRLEHDRNELILALCTRVDNLEERMRLSERTLELRYAEAANKAGEPLVSPRDGGYSSVP